MRLIVEGHLEDPVKDNGPETRWHVQREMREHSDGVRPTGRAVLVSSPMSTEDARAASEALNAIGSPVELAVEQQAWRRKTEDRAALVADVADAMRKRGLRIPHETVFAEEVVQFPTEEDPDGTATMGRVVSDGVTKYAEAAVDVLLTAMITGRRP